MKRYVIGFLLSLALTSAAFLVVEVHIWSGHQTFSHLFLYTIIVVCAVLQLGVQLFCFFHLGQRGNRMNRAMLAFALVVIFIVAGGALWIMYNLNSRMTPTQDQMLQYMNDQSSAL